MVSKPWFEIAGWADHRLETTVYRPLVHKAHCQGRGGYFLVSLVASNLGAGGGVPCSEVCQGQKSAKETFAHRYPKDPAVVKILHHSKCTMRIRKALDTFNFLRHVTRAILSLRPKCSHRCASLKETPLKHVQSLKHTTKNSTEQTSMRTKRFKHITI